MEGLAGGDTSIVYIEKNDGAIESYRVLMETPSPGVRTLTVCILDDLIINVPGHVLQHLIAEWYCNFSEEHEWEEHHLSLNDVKKIITACTPYRMLD